MHEKHASDGLVILTVTLDDPRDAKVRAATEKFLAEGKPFKGKKLPFRTFNLDADPEKLPATLSFNGFPGGFVFNRENRYVKKLPLLTPQGEPIEEFTDAAFEKAALEALKKK